MKNDCRNKQMEYITIILNQYVRKGDLKRMVTAYEDVFTFHKEELKRFEKLLIETLLKK